MDVILLSRLSLQLHLRGEGCGTLKFRTVGFKTSSCVQLPRDTYIEVLGFLNFLGKTFLRVAHKKDEPRILHWDLRSKQY